MKSMQRNGIYKQEEFHNRLFHVTLQVFGIHSESFRHFSTVILRKAMLRPSCHHNHLVHSYTPAEAPEQGQTDFGL